MPQVATNPISCRQRQDKLPFLLRTVCALEPAHVRLIVLIGTPEPGKGQMANTRLEGCVTPEELVEAWPQAADLVYPMIALLSREGLTNDRALGGYGGGNVWGLTEYGRRVLRFLPETGDWTRRLDTAEVVLRIDEGNTLAARNLGPGEALDVLLHPPNRSDGGSILGAPTPPSGLPALEVPPGPFDLVPEAEAQFPVSPSTLTPRMKMNPDLLPLDEFGLSGPPMVVGRETTLPSGRTEGGVRSESDDPPGATARLRAKPLSRRLAEE